MEIGNYDHLHEIKYFKYDEYLKEFSIGIYHWGLGQSDRCWTPYPEYLFEEAEKSFAILDKEYEQKLANEAYESIDKILNGISNKLFNLNILISNETFKLPNPKGFLEKELSLVTEPKPPNLPNLLPKPLSETYTPQIDFIDNLIKSRKRAKIKESEIEYENAIKLWLQKNSELSLKRQRLTSEFDRKQEKTEKQKNLIREKYKKLESEWLKKKEDFFSKQKERNEKVQLLKETLPNWTKELVISFSEIVLENIEFPSFFPHQFILDYNPENKILIVEYSLPAPEDLPTLIEYKYIKSKDDYKEVHLTQTKINSIFDTLVYQVTLRTIYELFSTDQVDAIASVVFNGWVNSFDKATGKKINSCIVSIQVTKQEFLEIDLTHVDPKACFKTLKGIGSSKLSGIVAIQPIVQVNKYDKRFISSVNVAENIGEGDNLALMDWQDFEQLIRELFEKEFSSVGGEVKVTQASRDGGVDAIAFDPDPIRGGKIVIQAKRYSNTVGVAAVRDLYGTVVNEGATKGLLVTTSDYGPDAYEFAKNKPLTLMNGANLLYLLEKHGHKAKIDLVEAKRILGQNLK